MAEKKKPRRRVIKVSVAMADFERALKEIERAMQSIGRALMAVSRGLNE